MFSKDKKKKMRGHQMRVFASEHWLLEIINHASSGVEQKLQK